MKEAMIAASASHSTRRSRRTGFSWFSDGSGIFGVCDSISEPFRFPQCGAVANRLPAEDQQPRRPAFAECGAIAGDRLQVHAPCGFHESAVILVVAEFYPVEFLARREDVPSQCALVIVEIGKAHGAQRGLPVALRFTA